MRITASQLPSISFSNCATPAIQAYSIIKKVWTVSYGIFYLGKEVYLAGRGIKDVFMGVVVEWRRSIKAFNMQGVDERVRIAWQGVTADKMGYILTQILEGCFEFITGICGIIVNLHYLKVLNLKQALKPLERIQLFTYLVTSITCLSRCLWMLFETKCGTGLAKHLDHEQRHRVQTAASLGAFACSCGILSAILLLASVAPWIVFPIGLVGGVVVVIQFLYVYYYQLKSLVCREQDLGSQLTNWYMFKA